MKRDVVVYFGMGFLPDNNAVACREQAIGYIVKEAGYTPVLIGISSSLQFGEFEKTDFYNTTCYSIKYAETLTEKFKDTYVIKNTLISIFEDIGVERIKCFIMQDYQLGPMKQMKQYCHANNIAYVADIMDWFTPTRDCSVAKNISKTIDTYLRMHWFYPYLKNKIYISHKFAQHFNDSDKKNVLVLPCTCKDTPNALQRLPRMNRNITMTFAGFLGSKCEKEKLDWIIQALYENKSNIKLNVIGITKEEFVSRIPNLAECITEHICFWGYLPRRECVKILQQSDFSIIARKYNKLSEYGFSSKMCEAFSYGIPIIATNNSDNWLYIRDGVNGYICDANYVSLKELLKKIENIELVSIEEMHRYILTDNPLSVNKYITSFSSFVDNMIV